MAINFSSSQQQAIRHKDGPLLVLAGPGSGKTSVITARAAHLVEHHQIPPEQILIITFTKAAAKELYGRLCKNQNPILQRISVRTFHSFFYQILQHTYKGQLPSIISSQEQYKIVHKLLKANNIFPTNHLVIKEYLSTISKRKSQMQFNAQTEELISYIQGCYEEQLKRVHKMDMDDIQLKTYRLLKNQPNICSFWQEVYKYIMIDEYQDICDIQFQCMHLLFGKKENMFVVGDEDQSIYSFRGSKPQIMLNFLNVYSKGKKVLLETNYRCSKPIVKSARNLISYNRNRFQKELQAFHKDWQNPIDVRGFFNRTEQLEYILNSVVKQKNTAVLYRSKKQAMGLIELFIAHNIPFYTKEVMPNLHEHWIVQELMATIILAAKACETNKTLWFWNHKQENKWNIHKKMLKDLPPYGGVIYIRKAMEYEKYLMTVSERMHVAYEDSLDVLEQFTKCIQTMGTWKEYEHYVSMEKDCLQRSTYSQSTNETEKIFLSTMHGAKGLEFEEVFILDVNEGITPYKKAGVIENLEEERRLFYVAMTRAKKKLHLLYVSNSQQNKQPSRFLYEAFQTTDLNKNNQLFTSNSSSLTNSSYSLASNHSSNASDTISYSSSSSMLSKIGSSFSFSE